MDQQTKGGRQSLEAWEQARKWFLSGVSKAEVARRLGVSEMSVHKHAKAWGKPNFQKKLKIREVASVKSDQITKDSSPTGTRDSLNPYKVDQVTKDSSSALSISPNSAPQDYQNELSQALKVLSVQGLRELEPPRNWSEMKILNDMIRKADGLDARDKGGPVSLLVNVGASLSRRGVVVEAVEVEPEGVDSWLV
jgi:hypothetical protein